MCSNLSTSRFSWERRNMEQNKYSNLLLQAFATCGNQNIHLCTVVYINILGTGWDFIRKVTIQLWWYGPQEKTTLLPYRKRFYFTRGKHLGVQFVEKAHLVRISALSQLKSWAEHRPEFKHPWVEFHFQVPLFQVFQELSQELSKIISHALASSLTKLFQVDS